MSSRRPPRSGRLRAAAAVSASAARRCRRGGRAGDALPRVISRKTTGVVLGGEGTGATRRTACGRGVPRAATAWQRTWEEARRVEARRPPGAARRSAVAPAAGAPLGPQRVEASVGAFEVARDEDSGTGRHRRFRRASERRDGRGVRQAGVLPRKPTPTRVCGWGGVRAIMAAAQPWGDSSSTGQFQRRRRPRRGRAGAGSRPIARARGMALTQVAQQHVASSCLSTGWEHAPWM